jgi:hypothetical protein
MLLNFILPEDAPASAPEKESEKEAENSKSVEIEKDFDDAA